ncbi:hypothetical protein AAMO2058_000630500 [Amorphochlora amoebiformis]
MDTRVTLLNFCDYVQWVPGSDAVVAQSRNMLYVWYRIEQTDQVVTEEIKGDVQEIERLEGRAQVVVEEGMDRVVYLLDEDLISFDTALHDMQLSTAMSVLERMDANKRAKEAQTNKKSRHSSSTRESRAEDGTIERPLGDITKSGEGMWMQLAKVAMGADKFEVAQRAYSALGDIARAQVMGDLAEVARENGGTNHFLVKAKKAVTARQFKLAEALYLDHGRVDLAIDMYRSLFKWSEALSVARAQNHPRAESLAGEYHEYLISTHQHEIAGQLMERDGKFSEALQLYLSGGYPAHAARVVTEQGLTEDPQLLEKVANALVRKGMYLQAGRFFESINSPTRGLESYLKGNAFREAVALSRRLFPEKVVGLQERWGDHLSALGQADAACAHYIEAGCNLKAIDAAIRARQWKKAIQGLDNVDDNVGQPYLKRIAEHYASTQEYHLAERYFVQAKVPMRAVKMYFNADRFKKAHSVATAYLPEGEVKNLYLKEAKAVEAKGKYREAANLYVAANQADFAIDMYRRHRRFDEMLEIVAKYKPKEQLLEQHFNLARQLEKEAKFQMAEIHYLKADKLQAAVEMYKNQDRWEDALRLAKKNGVGEYKKTAYFFAISVGGEAGIEFLRKRGLGELAVQYAVDSNMFTEAFLIAEKFCKEKLTDVHYQYALALEDEGHFERAEEEFIKANKPKEAIDMYSHQRKWEDAMRVAQAHDHISISGIYEEKARAMITEKNFSGAESLFLKAKKPEEAIKMYQVGKDYTSALRVARSHAPHLVRSIETDQNTYTTEVADTGSLPYRRAQAKLMEQREQFSEAIDAYLSMDDLLTHDDEERASVNQSAWILAKNYCPERKMSVARKVAGRLSLIKRYGEAANILQSAGFYRDAVEMLLEGQMYEQAGRVAQAHCPDMQRHVEQMHQKHLVEAGDTEKLSQVNPNAAIEIFINQGDWQKVYQLASRRGKETTVRCAAQHALAEANMGKISSSISILRKHGLRLDKLNITIYEDICRTILGSGSSDEGSSVVPNTHIQLYDLLRISLGDEKTKSEKKGVGELHKYLHIAYLSQLRRQCEDLKLNDLVHKQSVALLRYSDVLPVDVSFYNAAKGCQDAGSKEMAFVFFNRFLDISDAIVDEEEIDEQDLEITDIPSVTTFELPKKCNVDEGTRSDVRDWALDAGMSNTISNDLPTRRCEKCQTKTYKAGVSCHSCRHAAPECIVTGWPVIGASASCHSCQSPARKEAWNAFVMKARVCPWCGVRASAVY